MVLPAIHLVQLCKQIAWILFKHHLKIISKPPEFAEIRREISHVMIRIWCVYISHSNLQRWREEFTFLGILTEINAKALNTTMQFDKIASAKIL